MKDTKLFIFDNEKYISYAIFRDEQHSSTTEKGDRIEYTNEIVLDDIPGPNKFWLGKDYINFIVKDFHNLDNPFQDLVDRSTTPRMPWHDVGVMVQGAAARDVARHFIQRWNAVKVILAFISY